VDNLQQSDKFRFWNNEFYLHKTNWLRFTVWTGEQRTFSLIDFQPGQAARHTASGLIHCSGGKEAPAYLLGAGASLCERTTGTFAAPIAKLMPVAFPKDFRCVLGATASGWSATATACA